jgi:hypothetical protein
MITKCGPIGRRLGPGVARWLVCALAAASVAQAGAAPKLGTRSSEIGTFNGWTFFLGWEGSFSDTYAPVKEKYSWNVFIAPEAIYVGLLAQQAVYSGVDVSMGIKYFYGFLRAPNSAQTISATLMSDDVSSLSFSIGYPDGTPPVGIMSQLSMGFEVEQAFMRIGSSKRLLDGVQWGAGFSASFSLLPVSLPFTVELDRDWVAPPAEPAPSLFWPIVIWNRTVNPARHPIDQIQDALSALAQTGGLAATDTLVGSTLQPLMDRVMADQDLRAFISDPAGNSRIRQAMTATETWLVTSDTSNLGEALKPIKSSTEARETVRPVLAVTQLAFETGYRVGAQANPNNRTVYVDGVVTNYCVIGEKCTLEVRVAELLEAIPGRSAAEFEGAWLGFDWPVEGGGSYDALGKVEWVQMTNGVARFTIAQSLSTPQLLGVRYDDPSDAPLNGGRDVELKRRLLLFVDPSDMTGNGIPDFWEDRYLLTDRTPGADADRDGFSNYQEYLGDTNPTNAADLVLLKLNPKTKELVLPFASSVRRYRIQANTNSLANTSAWINVMSFMGADAEESIDLSPVFKQPAAFFRLKVEKP